jgi:hypothetical protein
MPVVGDYPENINGSEEPMKRIFGAALAVMPTAAFAHSFPVWGPASQGPSIAAIAVGAAAGAALFGSTAKVHRAAGAVFGAVFGGCIGLLTT